MHLDFSCSFVRLVTVFAWWVLREENIRDSSSIAKVHKDTFQMLMELVFLSQFWSVFVVLH